ncbi:uncharacterized protein LOC110269466 [Arachis ipaensis]|uniref:uncharacterized protein LOC110269466 n=1 Tax=Arachis ipaensis TaxID=130454 RepID=UPI000A2B93AA|nr:uncharacterized protein LOC110269466 [Arachis ipaensis]
MIHENIPLQAILCASLYPNVAASEHGIIGAVLSTFNQSSNTANSGRTIWFGGRREVRIHPFNTPFSASLKRFVNEREHNNAFHSLQPPALAASEDTTSVEASEAPSQAVANSISSDGATRCSNSKSSSAWNVEIIEVDEEGAAYGEAQGLLVGYCGILATNARIFPISFEKWSGQENSGMPKSFKDECFDTMIKPHFHFTSTEKIVYRYCIQSIAKKWATYRQRLWNEFYDPTMRREALVNNVPDDIPRDQWACFVNYRLKPSTVELCMKNKENRSKQTIPHTCGSKSSSRRRLDLMRFASDIDKRRKKVKNC